MPHNVFTNYWPFILRYSHCTSKPKSKWLFFCVLFFWRLSIDFVVEYNFCILHRTCGVVKPWLFLWYTSHLILRYQCVHRNMIRCGARGRNNQLNTVENDGHIINTEKTKQNVSKLKDNDNAYQKNSTMKRTNYMKCVPLAIRRFRIWSCRWLVSPGHLQLQWRHRFVWSTEPMKYVGY